MDNDLDTVKALNVLRQFAASIQAAADAGRSVESAQVELRKMADVFGLRLTDSEPDARVLEGWERHLKRFM